MCQCWPLNQKLIQIPWNAPRDPHMLGALSIVIPPPHVRNFVHSNSKQSSTEREDDLLILSLMLRMDIKLAPMIEGIGREENLLYIDKFVLLTIRKTCILISHFSHFLIQNITFVFPIFYNIVGASS